jgi:hypothetical protein
VSIIVNTINKVRLIKLLKEEESTMSNPKDVPGDKPSEYKEKIWGKDVDGEYVIDGFTFRGKHRFSKVVEELKGMMKKGAQIEIKGSAFKVLDDRKNGVGIDVEIEMVENNVRGIAILRLFGPNNKKENVVIVSKCKDSDYVFVTALAEKITKPLMKSILMGNESSEILVKGMQKTEKTDRDDKNKKNK